MAQPENFSVTQARAYDACPMQYRLRYLTDLEPPTVTDEARDFGRAIHAALAAGYRFLAGVQDEPSYPINLLRSVALDALEDRWYAEGLGTGDSLDEAREHVLAEFDDTYLAGLASGWRVVGVEKRFKVLIPYPVKPQTDTPPPPPFPVVCIVDLVLESRRAPVIMVQDHKTGDRISSIEDVKHNLQLGVYVPAVQVEYPEHSVIAALNYTGQPPGQRLVTGRLDEKDLAMAAAKLARIRERVDASTAEMEFPARPGAICSWCDFNSICPASVGLELVR